VISAESDDSFNTLVQYNGDRSRAHISVKEARDAPTVVNRELYAFINSL